MNRSDLLRYAQIYLALADAPSCAAKEAHAQILIREFVAHLSAKHK